MRTSKTTERFFRAGLHVFGVPVRWPLWVASDAELRGKEYLAPFASLFEPTVRQSMVLFIQFSREHNPVPLPDEHLRVTVDVRSVPVRATARIEIVQELETGRERYFASFLRKRTRLWSTFRRSSSGRIEP